MITIKQKEKFNKETLERFYNLKGMRLVENAMKVKYGKVYDVCSESATVMTLRIV